MAAIDRNTIGTPIGILHWLAAYVKISSDVDRARGGLRLRCTQESREAMARELGGKLAVVTGGRYTSAEKMPETIPSRALPCGNSRGLDGSPTACTQWAARLRPQRLAVSGALKNAEAA